MCLQVSEAGIQILRHQQVLAAVDIIDQRKILDGSLSIMRQGQRIVQHIPIVYRVAAG